MPKASYNNLLNTYMMKASNWLNVLLGAGLVTLAVLLATGHKETDNTTPRTTQGMDALDCIMTRVSVREFTDRQVPDSVVESLLKAGMAAPTAMNKQPWQFMVVTDRSTREAIAQTDKYIRAKEAPLVIVACGDLAKEDDSATRDFWIQDVSAATENILLAAHAQGLGAVWCGIHPIEERVNAISRILGLPKDIVPLSAVCIGYPAHDHQPKDKWNPQAVHRDKY